MFHIRWSATSDTWHWQAAVRAKRCCTTDLRVSSPAGVTTMSHHCSAVFIGCRCLKESPIWLAAIVYRCLHGFAPAYLTSELVPVSQDRGRHRLRSSSTTDLVIPRVRHATIEERAFAASATSAWNSIANSTRSAPSLNTFNTHLKTELFQRSFKA